MPGRRDRWTPWSSQGPPAHAGVDTNSFLGILRARTQLATLDLPTEAQWEYAGRAGTGTALNNGKNLTSLWDACPNMAEVGRYTHNGGWGYTPTGNASVGTAPVGSYLPNAWGVYDMHGNVWEWCLDWYGSYQGDAQDPAGPPGPTDQFNWRVYRSGSYLHNARYCRSAARNYSFMSNNANNAGFRLLMTLP